MRAAGGPISWIRYYQLVGWLVLAPLLFASACGGNASSGSGTPAGGGTAMTASSESGLGPGLRRYRFTAADLPRPNATPSAVNPARVVPRSEKDLVTVPPGFTAIVAAENFRMPRQMALFPNGDVAISESDADKVTLLRDADGDGRFERRWPWLEGIPRPFGIAATPGYIYVAGTDRVVRCAYAPGDTLFPGEPEFVAHLTPGGYNQHWTRNLLYDAATNRMYVTVGSRGNAGEEEELRAAVHRFTVAAT